MYHHRITYTPKPDTRASDAIHAILTVLVFAFIGVLLAWRG